MARTRSGLLSGVASIREILQAQLQPHESPHMDHQP